MTDPHDEYDLGLHVNRGAEINPKGWQFGEIAYRRTGQDNAEIVWHLKEYVSVMADEPAGQLYSFTKLYHDLNRILGNEE